MTTNNLIDIRDLRIDYVNGTEETTAVKGISLSIARGETVALVGESGSGKTTLALSLIGLLPASQSRVRGSLQIDGTEMAGADEAMWRPLRGRRIGMVFQDPFSALNPVLTIRRQIEETVELDDRHDASRRAQELLRLVQLTDTDRILRSYPHQISGGQRQRVLIAIALARNPDLLIADEPTSALDVTVQDDIMKLLNRLQTGLGMAVLFVTHNLPLARQIAARTAVMYRGELVESGATADVLSKPTHPYTQNLLGSVLRLRPTGGR